MTTDELRSWLKEHCDTIVMFMDYEPYLESEEELAETLGYWFDGSDWKTDGQRFVQLGADGTGSQFAAWIRDGVAEIPVVIFGSEGGRGVVAKSCEDWAKIIAHAPSVDEYGDDDLAEIDVGFNFLLDEDENDPDELQEAKDALADYKQAVEARFGSLPAFEDLTTGLKPMSEEFGAWIDSVLE